MRVLSCLYSGARAAATLEASGARQTARIAAATNVAAHDACHNAFRRCAAFAELWHASVALPPHTRTGGARLAVPASAAIGAPHLAALLTRVEATIPVLAICAPGYVATVARDEPSVLPHSFAICLARLAAPILAFVARYAHSVRALCADLIPAFDARYGALAPFAVAPVAYTAQVGVLFGLGELDAAAAAELPFALFAHEGLVCKADLLTPVAFRQVHLEVKLAVLFEGVE